MLKTILVAASLMTATAASAQMANPCPSGTQPATIRHNKIKPGQWATFAKAVAAHNAWYTSHNDPTRTTLLRVLTKGTGGPTVTDAEAVTITRYGPTKSQAARDAAYSAFTDLYRQSSDMADETRVCLPKG
ncbi:hypothetical protein [uncultured Sphingomonas sp.]|uniref:hypothetical protein n=1 Tax=uncultured Sphingomonas sp. TaxID=158754 RepID=UPI0025DEF801|nr:hypothetical protein [uncultured Sphingomonas sp.]